MLEATNLRSSKAISILTIVLWGYTASDVEVMGFSRPKGYD
jgi:hypothetical protein